MTSVYAQSIPCFIHGLRQMSTFLTKGAAYCAEKGIKPEDMISHRLVPDMRGLTHQVQSCTDTAKFTVKRLGGVEVPAWEDNEATFEELQARLSKAIALLEGVDPKVFDGVHEKEAIMETKTMGTFRFETGQNYVSEFALPNFHFHLATGYCLLRAQGVPLGALDYLGNVFHKME